MKTQLELLKEAIALAEENPGLKIYVAVADEHCDDYTDSSWTQHQISKVEKTLYYRTNDTIYTTVDGVIEYHEVYLDEDITEDDARAKMEYVILIYTNAA